jgi:hypothetical protein
MTFTDLKDDPTPEAPAAMEDPAPSADLADSPGEETDLIAVEKKPINRSAVTLFVIVAIGTAATYFMHLRAGPQSAAGADPTMVLAETAITDFMKGGKTNIVELNAMLDGTAKEVEQFRDYTNVAQVPLGELKVNPFQSSALKPLQPVEDSAETARKKKEEEHAAVVKAVQALQLQTIVIRTNRKACIISNTMVQEGDSLGDFKIDKITPSAVVVRNGAYKFELRMGK